MNDLASLTGAPTMLTVDGKSYRVYPLTLRDFGFIQAWVDAQFKDPLEIAEEQISRGRCEEDRNRHLIRTAMDLRSSQGKRVLGTPEADAHLTSPEGVKQLLLTSIRKGDPNFSFADADALFASMNQVTMIRFLEATNADAVIGDHDSEGGKMDAWYGVVRPPSSSVVNWWRMFHSAMENASWASPEAIGKMTIPQLICLCNERPPGEDRKTISSADDYLKMAEEDEAKERDWYK